MGVQDRNGLFHLLARRIGLLESMREGSMREGKHKTHFVLETTIRLERERISIGTDAQSLRGWKAAKLLVRKGTFILPW